MRAYSFVLQASVLFLLNSGCATPQPEYRATATVQEIMKSIIDPSADVVWGSVGTIMDAEGTHERAPQTEEEWAEVRRHIITLIEASNLLLVPGRRVVAPGEKLEEGANIMLSIEEIQALMEEDRESWDRLSLGLHDAAMASLAAADARNAEAIFTTGGELYESCEQCHNKYWYPAEVTRGLQ